MLKALTAIRRFSRDDGQDLIEYAMLAALIAVVALGAVQAVGTTIQNVFWSAIAASSV
jgi:Flp pilus assembly pilin Flp